MQPRAIIEAKGLTKRFGAITALDRLDLAVVAGESVVLFGPNGAGKTTLSRMLTGALRPTAGEVRIAGKDPRHDDRESKAAFGIISHQTFLYDDLSAMENLLFFARLYDVEDARERAESLLESMGLLDRAEDRAGTFSRGMQQRLSLARALIHDPEILFLDEPFTGLDPHAASVLRSTLETLRGRGRTLFLVTHNLAEGLELSDRWLILARGRVVADGASAGTDRLAFESFYFEKVRAGRVPTRGGA